MQVWLKNIDEFCEDDLELFDIFIPYCIHTITTPRWRSDGHGMKLIKVQLNHHGTYLHKQKIWTHSFPKNHKSKLKERDMDNNIWEVYFWQPVTSQLFHGGATG